MQLSICIVTKNRYKLLLRCIQSIDTKNKSISEIIVIDSSDVKRNLYSKFNHIRYIYDPSLNIPSARNLAIDTASKKNILFLDDDCELKSETLLEIQKQFRAFPKTQIVVGKIENATIENPFSRIQQVFYERWHKNANLNNSSVKQILNGDLIDFEILVGKKTFLKKFSFNTSIPFGRDEDVEIGRKMIKKTKYIYFNPFIVVKHHSRQSFFSLMKRNFISGYTAQYLVIKREKHNVSFEWYLNQIKRTKFKSIKNKLFFSVSIFIYPLVYKLGKISYNFTTMLHRILI